jgi:hypothetical protein
MEALGRLTVGPWLGDKWVICRLFQKRQYHKARTEIIITLIPHNVCLDGTSPRRSNKFKHSKCSRRSCKFRDSADVLS